MTQVNTLQRCDICDRPAVVVNGDEFLCSSCDIATNGSVANMELDAAKVESKILSGCGDAITCPSQPAAPCEARKALGAASLSFEAEVSALEASWLRDGNIIDILNSDGAIGLRGAR